MFDLSMSLTYDASETLFDDLPTAGPDRVVLAKIRQEKEYRHYSRQTRLRGHFIGFQQNCVL